MYIGSLILLIALDAFARHTEKMLDFSSRGIV